MYKKTEIYDTYIEISINKIDTLRANENDEECLKVYKEIIEQAESDSLEKIDDISFVIVLGVKFVSFVFRKLKHYDNFRTLGENAPVFLEYLIDNYKRVLKGIEITTENINYDNICNLIRQKVESDKFLSNFLTYIDECIDSKDFSVPNYNYYIACQMSRDKVLELDSMYSEEKTKNMHN